MGEIIKANETPLTREEMATYVDYLNTNTATTAKMIKEYCDSQTEAFVSALSNLKDTYNKKIDKLCDQIELLVNAQNNNSGYIESLRKSLFVIGKDIAKSAATLPLADQKKEINPKLVNSLSNEESSTWINDAWKSCSIIGKRCGKTKLQVLREVYGILRKSGEDIDKMMEEYKGSFYGKPSLINMIGHSDYYRPIVEKHIKELHVKYYPEKYEFKNTSYSCPSQEVMGCPQNIKSLLVSYAKKNNVSEHAARNIVYKKLKDTADIDFNAERSTFAKNIGYKRCSSGYFVSKVPALLTIMKKIVEE